MSEKLAKQAVTGKRQQKITPWKIFPQGHNWEPTLSPYRRTGLAPTTQQSDQAQRSHQGDRWLRYDRKGDLTQPGAIAPRRWTQTPVGIIRGGAGKFDIPGRHRHQGMTIARDVGKGRRKTRLWRAKIRWTLSRGGKPKVERLDSVGVAGGIPSRADLSQKKITTQVHDENRRSRHANIIRGESSRRIRHPRMPSARRIVWLRRIITHARTFNKIVQREKSIRVTAGDAHRRMKCRRAGKRNRSTTERKQDG